MTYEQIEAELRANHFYPVRITQDGQITALQIECPSLVTMDSKILRLKEILAEEKVKISGLKNEGYILIKKIK